MSAEDRCRVCKELLEWSKTTDTREALYMEEKVYAVKIGYEKVMLVKADSEVEAIRKARPITVNMYGDNATQIGYIHNMTM